MDINDMKTEIQKFLNQYDGTTIGQSIYNRMCNLRDDDYEGIEAIYDELEEGGYI